MLTHMDNLSLYGINGQLHMLEGVYANNHGVSITVDPDVNAPGSLAAQVSNFGHLDEGFRRIENVADTVVGAAWRWWIDSIPADGNDRPVVKFLNAVGEPVVSITINTSGGVDIRNGDTSGTVEASSAGPVMTPRGWYHFEVRMDSTVDGNVEVRVEGHAVASLLHQNYNTTMQQFKWGMWSAGGPLDSCFYKDLVTWNSLGTHNNDFLGSVIVINLEPIADVALNWTPSTGADGFSILDNIPPDDTKYIRADNPPPASYKCSLAQLPLEITSVRALMTVVRASKFDGGDGSLQNGLISAATPVNGSDRPITVSQTYWRDIFEEDPATAAPWLPAAVNAVEMQINRTT